MRRDPRTPLLPSTRTRTLEETCRFYEELDIRRCRESRNASACLQREGCVFTTQQCVDVTATTKATDFRSSEAVDLWGSDVYYSQLMSGNTTICGVEDAACSACGPSINGLGETQRSNARVTCIGTSGCLCSDLVRYFDEHPSTSDSQCRLTPMQQNTTAMWSVSALVFLVLVPVWIMALIYDNPTRKARAATQAIRQLQHQAARVMRHMLDAVPGGFDLDLFGWRQHQQRLRYKEQQLLEGYENMSPVSRPVEYEAFPSAPEFDDEEEASAPTRQDPMALASAPVFTSRAETALHSHAVASAPPNVRVPSNE